MSSGSAPQKKKIVFNLNLTFVHRLYTDFLWLQFIIIIIIIIIIKDWLN